MFSALDDIRSVWEDGTMLRKSGVNWLNYGPLSLKCKNNQFISKIVKNLLKLAVNNMLKIEVLLTVCY